MDAVGIALWIASQGLTLIEKGKELWVKEGKDPEAFDAIVAADAATRAKTIASQQAAELAILGGK